MRKELSKIMLSVLVIVLSGLLFACNYDEELKFIENSKVGDTLYTDDAIFTGLYAAIIIAKKNGVIKVKQEYYGLPENYYKVKSYTYEDLAKRLISKNSK